MAEISKRRVEAMRAEGLPWKAIAGVYGVSIDKVRRAMGDTVYMCNAEIAAQHRRKREQRARDESRVMLKIAHRERGPSRQDVDARLREIPPDTRGLAARVLGDPLPGRSALDRMRAS